MSTKRNPSDYFGPNGVPVPSLTRDEIEQELCALYDLIGDLPSHSELVELSKRLDAIKDHVAL